MTPKEEHKYIKLGQSVIALVEDDMTEFEDNFMKHVLGQSSYLEVSDGDFARMRRYFEADKLDLTTITTSDTTCCRVTTVAITTAPAPAGSTTLSGTRTTGEHSYSE